MLCQAQFMTSCALAGCASLAKGKGVPFMSRELWPIVLPLSAFWSGGAPSPLLLADTLLPALQR